MIYKYDDHPNQPGHWFSIALPKSELKELREWLKTNLGASTKMAGSLAKGWYPLESDKTWTLDKCNGSYLLAIWTKYAATMFITFHEIHPISSIPRPDYGGRYFSYNYRSMGIDSESPDFDDEF